MSIWKAHTTGTTCDACGELSDFAAHTAAEARRIAAKNGWRITGGDFCPSCK